MTTEGAHIARQEALRESALPAGGEYLTYRLGGEEYGVDIQTVREIRSYEAPTRVPGAPRYVKGVVNLRGLIVPIVDLRLKLGVEAQYTPFTVVIVLAAGERMAGVVVDAVCEVLDLGPETIKAPPELAGGAALDFLTGIAGAPGERMLMLVDMERLLGPSLSGLPRLQ